LKQLSGRIARGRYADFVQVSLVTNFPIRRAEPNGDLVSSHSANCGKPSASGPGVAIGVPFNGSAHGVVRRFTFTSSPLARPPHGYHDTSLIRSELENAGFSCVVIETRAEQSRAPSPRLPAVAYCQGTPLRNEIEATGKLEAATDYAESAIADKHGRGEIAAKIQALVIVATV
jgi:hypothetical protein